jgi:hypothetical protein
MATKTDAAKDIQKRFRDAAFQVAKDSTGRLEVKKSGFVAFLQQKDGAWRYSGPPCFIDHGIQCELEDRGYQKFWYSAAQNKRFPIRKVELEQLHRFDEEVRYLLGSTTLYNESLGSVNARTVYDRLEGRPDR